MGKKKKNNFYAYETAESRGIVSSWPACEAKVKGRKARFKGFLDRATAERWLRGESVASEAGKPKKYYAYRTEADEGVVDSWDVCERKVAGHKARYRGFPDPASARKWLADGAPLRDKKAEKAAALREYPENAVFFDAGTGAGRGVEVRVADREETPIVHLAGDVPEGATLTKEGNLLLGRGRTNNYGELLGCLLAFAVAEKLGSKHIYGDSKLVIEYWSKGHVSKIKRADDPDLVELSKQTARARARFVKGGGRLAHVPGGINPADLGYHRE